MRTLIATLTLLFFVSFGFSQFGFQYNDSILVKRGGDTLDFAWVGGLNHAQFSTIDVDFDGREDLFIFDRSANQIRVFQSIESNGSEYYKYMHNGHQHFPSNVRYRAKMVDYNNDGKKDLFCYGIGGVKVYRNTGNSTDGLTWELEKTVLESEYASGNTNNLYVSSIDIPAYVDVDGDSDIDILTFHIGGERIEYHKNLSMENYGHSDSLEFKLKNECWGKFTENDQNNGITLNDTDGLCGNPSLPDPEKSARHSGSTVLSLDLNDDQVMDLILGDVAHNNLSGLTNGGSAPNQNSAMVNLDSNFPSNTTPVDIPIFPAPFYEDVNFDGTKDLIVGTNANGGSENRRSIWYYKNIGTNTQPNFTFETENFLQNQMIENGKGTIPVLVDLNDDGLKDLLVGSNFRYKDPLDKTSKIQYYQNTGTASEPEFTFVEDDWLGLSNEGYGLRMHPAFGDIDGDGDLEMLLGTEDGKIHLYDRTGNTPNDFSLSTTNFTDANGDIIDVLSHASPQIFDLNNDGLLDLIIGKRSAGIYYYENTGTASSPDFELVTQDLGGIDMGTQIYPDNYSVPMFIRHNDTTHLFAGNRAGTIYYFNEIDGNIADGDTFNLISDVYANIETAAFSAPFIDTIRDNNQYDLFVGADLGGLWAYKAEEFSDPIISVDNHLYNKEFQVYPNPSKEGIFHIRIDEQQTEYQLQVINNLGQTIRKEQPLWGSGVINLTGQGKGVYTLLIKDTHQRVLETRKLVVQ